VVLLPDRVVCRDMAASTQRKLPAQGMNLGVAFEHFKTGVDQVDAIE
jgi:hypothetical protein